MALVDLSGRSAERCTVGTVDWGILDCHVATMSEALQGEPFVIGDPSGLGGGDIVHDFFGRTIYGSDSKLRITGIYRIGETEMPWISEPVPTFARVLRESSRPGGVSSSRYYYEVLID